MRPSAIIGLGSALMASIASHSRSRTIVPRPVPAEVKRAVSVNVVTNDAEASAETPIVPVHNGAQVGRRFPHVSRNLHWVRPAPPTRGMLLDREWKRLYARRRATQTPYVYCPKRLLGR